MRLRSWIACQKLKSLTQPRNRSLKIGEKYQSILASCITQLQKKKEFCIYSLHSIPLSFLFPVPLQFYQDFKDLKYNATINLSTVRVIYTQESFTLHIRKYVIQPFFESYYHGHFTAYRRASRI